MTPFFAWVEESALNNFLTETNSVFVFPAILVLHAIGMALLVGTHAAIALRVLGIAPRMPLAAMASFLPIARIGLGVNVFSGVLLLISYPAKALTNPLFYAKLSLIVLALFVFAKIKRDAFVSPSQIPGKRYAALLLILWAATIAAGRFLAYTYTRLTAYH
jgi:hypothetical protein